MLALTTNELSAIVGAVLALVLFGLIALARDQVGLRERITRVEESVRSLRDTSRKED